MTRSHRSEFAHRTVRRVAIGTQRLAAAALLVATAVAQVEPRDEPESTTVDGLLRWPQDADLVVCVVGGREHTLRDVLTHLDERHYPRMLELMDEATGAAYLESPLAATWIRQYADIQALELEARAGDHDLEDAKPALGAALKRGFEAWLRNYTEQRAARGRPVELTQDRVNLLLTDYQRNEGLGTEVQGWLDFLVDAVDTEDVGLLKEYYLDHPQYFGGVLTVAQIMVRHRDPRTLQLLPPAERREAYDRLADLRRQLAEEPGRFEELARRYSDDPVTASQGGVMQGVKRFDDRLPAVLPRMAWSLRDGEVSTPVESAYGIHLVKRIGYNHLYYVLFNERIYGDIAATMRRERQEDVLFRARERHGVTLRY